MSSREFLASTKRVAIVGCGPKGLYALDSLCNALDSQDAAQITVVVFDCSEHFGAGATYSFDQPHYLLMNYAASYIDAWDRVLRPSHINHPDFNEWLKKQQPDVVATEFPPRALVGKYLNFCYKKVLEVKPGNIEVIEVKGNATDLIQVGRKWLIGNYRECGLFDEMLVATGHQDLFKPQSLYSVFDPSLKPLRVYPVDKNLAADKVLPNSKVAVKGFGLTWVDACLALTEGRGGQFVADGYLRSGKEPSSIVPFSRTGRPMLSKTSNVTEVSNNVAEFWDDEKRSLEALMVNHGAINFMSDIWPVITNASDRLLEVEAGSSQKWFDTWIQKTFSGSDAYSAMRTSLDAATGVNGPDCPTALGISWRRLYSNIVNLVSHGGLTSASWAAFKHTSTEMERIAFGPPHCNVRKILTLVDIGIVDLSQIRCGRVIGESNWPSGSDCRVDATLPASGKLSPAGPLHSLVRDDAVLLSSTGGIEVSRSAQVNLGNDDTSTLAVLGRPTEGVVLGNDTLSRTLHTHPTEWAARVVKTFNSEAARNAHSKRSA